MCKAGRRQAGRRLMAAVYTEQLDGTLLGLEDDILIILRPLTGDRHGYKVWLDDEIPAYQGQAGKLEEAKARVSAWLLEALRGCTVHLKPACITALALRESAQVMRVIGGCPLEDVYAEIPGQRFPAEAAAQVGAVDQHRRSIESHV